ncbi:MAG: hypothetical protein RLZZ584_763 [Pseudomonadota bacterium]|jgi:hypothetical protein
MDIPCRTLAGEAELASPGSHLGRRQRSLLFLVDGRRTLAELLVVSADAGVPGHCLRDLLDLGLVAMQATADLAEYDAVPVEVERRWAAEGLQGVVRRRAGMVHLAGQAALDAGDPREAAVVRWVPSGRAHAAALPQSGRPRLGDAGDADLTEARRLVAHALKRVAPLSSALTRVQVRRAQDRRALRALLPAVRRRLANQPQWPGLWPLMRRVEQLLAS